VQAIRLFGISCVLGEFAKKAHKSEFLCRPYTPYSPLVTVHGLANFLARAPSSLARKEVRLPRSRFQQAGAASRGAESPPKTPRSNSHASALSPLRHGASLKPRAQREHPRISAYDAKI
jgi:hypothetical protein